MDGTAGSSKDDSSDICAICLCPVTERAITSPCSHYTFDFLCLVSWLQERSTCPLCMKSSSMHSFKILTVYKGKADVTAVEYDWRSPTDYKTYKVNRTHPPVQTAPPASSTTRNLSAYPRHYIPRRPRANRRPYERVSADIALLRRRHVYRTQMFSLHVGTNRISRYQNFTPEMIASSAELQSRARMWIRRELNVFSFLHADEGAPANAATTSSNAEFLLTYIVSILKTVDIKASNGHAEDLLQEFLGRDNTRLFLHELHAWLRSPYTKLEDWDRHVQYRERLPDEFDADGRPIRTAKTPRSRMGRPGD